MGAKLELMPLKPVRLKNCTSGRIKKRILPAFVLLSLVFVFTPASEALVRCNFCQYLIDSDALTCPKCLRTLKWPVVPERARNARVVVRTGYDAFIRHPHANIRLYKANHNSGGDRTGHIGSWGGKTTLRYLLCFDIPEAFAGAQINLQGFVVRRALLKLSIDDTGKHNGLPVKIYPLTRPFQPGSGKAGTRNRQIDGCNWFYSSPLIVWQREGGDFAEKPFAVAILAENGSNEAIIDVTEIIQARFNEYAKTGIWNDPGLIIMSDSERYNYSGYITIHSLEASRLGQTVRSPELFIH